MRSVREKENGWLKGMERGEADGDKQEVAWKEKKKSKQKMKEQYGVKCEYEIPWKDHEEGKKKNVILKN